MGCTICGSQNLRQEGILRSETQIEDKNKLAGFRAISCDACGFAFIIPNMNESGIKVSSLYDQHYFDIKPSLWWRNKRQAQRRQRLQLLQEYARVKVETFLDIGCGEGDTLKIASEEIKGVYGLDVTNNFKKENIKDIPQDNIFIGQLKDAKYSDDMFDVIFMDSVLEHILEPAQTLQEIKRILSPGGCLFVGVPNEFCLETTFKTAVFKIIKPGVSARLEPFRNPYHVVGFSKSSARRIFNNCGLEVIDLRTFGIMNEFMKHRVNSAAFYKTLAFWPVYALSVLTNNARFIEVYATKNQ